MKTKKSSERLKNNEIKKKMPANQEFALIE